MTESLAMFVYLADCPDDRLKKWILVYSGLMENSTVQEVLASLGDIAANTRYPQDSLIAQKILLKWSEILSLTNRDIERLMVSTSKSKSSEASTNITSLPPNIARGLVIHNHTVTDTRVSDLARIQTLTTHPVHIIDSSSSLSPSALIPFCDLGGKMDLTDLTMKLDQFSLPVCTAFRRKIFEDQLCYDVDVNVYKDPLTLEDLKLGFSFVVDLNGNRRTSLISTEDKQDGTNTSNYNLGNLMFVQ